MDAGSPSLTVFLLFPPKLSDAPNRCLDHVGSSSASGIDTFCNLSLALPSILAMLQEKCSKRPRTSSWQ